MHLILPEFCSHNYNNCNNRNFVTCENYFETFTIISGISAFVSEVPLLVFVVLFSSPKQAVYENIHIFINFV